jgi:inosine-uridine nucleoside N-ribohydrolase
VFRDAHTRARLALRLLEIAGRGDVPVAAGSPAQREPEKKGQFAWAAETRRKIEAETAPEFLYRRLKASPREITVIAVGPLTNVARLLTDHPDAAQLMKRLVIMGGAVRVGYKPGEPVVAEWNIKCDVAAAQTVFSSGVSLDVAPLDATAIVGLDAARRRRVFDSGALGKALEELYKLWGNPTPILYDPVAVAMSFEQNFTRIEELRLEVTDHGITRVVESKPNARVATGIRRDEFLDWYVGLLSSK